MLATGDDDCDDCTSDYLTPHFGPKAAFSTLPFLATFGCVTFIAYRRVYPLLSKISTHSDKTRSSGFEPSTQNVVRRIAALTFSSTIALSAVLTELLLCEISNSFNPTARTAALQITVASLLGLLVVAIPLLGIHTVVASSGPTTTERKIRIRLQWVLEFIGYVVFLFGFWALGALLPKQTTPDATGLNLFQACLDRLGITGVTLMAMLSGFASVSAIWQTFGPKSKPVTETDISRKQAGLDATVEIAAEKRRLLDSLERKLSNVPSKGFWSKTVGSFRGNADAQEKQTLEMEVTGLETMASTLESSLNVLRTRRADQLRSTTKLGRLSIAFSFAFACYCVYRIFMATLNITRRLIGRGSYGKADTDPVTYTIALFARHVYPSLDQDSWAQQISFLLSGAMLLASFSAVTQTFHLFARFMPSVLQATRTNFALLISQISGMYVISSALMLRGMMPEKVGSVINGALGAGLLEPAWLQRCFDGFFMLAVTITTVGIFLGKQIGDGLLNDDPGWDCDVEMGKRS
jgi:Abscisic acid G-protein coupled receptor/The Golgi pH Regulator (GPHR) Family N-terminal